MKFVLTAILVLSSEAVFARKFAVVIGGVTRANQTSSQLTEFPRHEFAQGTARAAYGLQRQGYEVSTFFDTAGIPDGQLAGKLADLRNGSAQDFAKLGSAARAATKDNILNELRRIRDTASPGDQVEFNLKAHGYRSCPGDESGLKGVSVADENRSNTRPGCQHVIALADPATGGQVLIPTSEIADIVREIDAKGIRANVNLMSCHAGAAQEAFAGLQNSCVMYGSTANNFALSCMPQDEDWDPSFTSAMDNVEASQYMAYYDEMLNDPYFKDDLCLKKIGQHYRSKNIGGDNRYDLFMSARRWDLNGEEPSLSSQLGFNYFTTGLFTPIGALYGAKGSAELCSQDIDNRIAELQALADQASVIALNGALAPKRARLLDLMNRYNDIIQRQLAAGASPPEVATSSTLVSSEPEGVVDDGEWDGAPVEMTDEMRAMFGDMPALETQNEKPSSTSQASDFRNLTPEQREAIQRLQREALELSKEVMAAEREIVDDLDRAVMRQRIPASDPCKRS